MDFPVPLQAPQAAPVWTASADPLAEREVQAPAPALQEAIWRGFVECIRCYA